MFDNDRFNKSCEWCRKMNKMYSVKESSLTFAEWCYRKGKADGVRKFAELLDNDADIGIYDYYGNKISAIDLLAEWQKGAEK